MLKSTLYVGLFDKDSKQQIIETGFAEKICQELIGDCSIGLINGYYTHENGTKVVEPSLRIEILFNTKERIKAICEQIKILLNQESVAVQYEEIEGELVWAKSIMKCWLNFLEKATI